MPLPEYVEAVKERMVAAATDAASVMGSSVIATLFSVGVHAHTAFGGAYLTADFPSDARKVLEAEKPGSIALFVQGFGGDINPMGGKVQLGQDLAANVDSAASSAVALQGGLATASVTVQGTSAGVRLYAHYWTADGNPRYFLVGNYNAATQRHLRIRHDVPTDQVRWETSPDGTSWTQVFSWPREFDLSAVRADLTAGSWQSSPNPGVARFGPFSLR